MTKDKTQRMVEIEDKRSHEFLSEPLLMPNVNRTNGNRSQMFTSHIGQCIQLTGAEPPLIQTGFENQVGKYSTGYKKANRDFEVIYKFEKNKYVNYYLIKYKDNDEYDVIIREEANHLAEKFGNKYNNDEIDKLKVGDTVSKETVLFKDQNYDEDNNFQYGANATSVFLPFKGMTNEDGIVVSESLAEKMSSYFVNVINITINTNDIPLNLYGNEDEYKSFPDVGEEVQNGVLCATRRLNYDEIIHKFKNEMLNKTLEDDNAYKVHGKVIDIDVLNNEDIEKLENQKYSEQFVKYIKELRHFYKTFVTVTDDIVRKKKFSNDLIRIHNKFKGYIDDNAKLVYDNNQFDKIIFRVKVLEKKPLVHGSKITTRYGGKGVVAEIVPDDQMPMITEFDGEDFTKDSTKTPISKRVDLIHNNMGIINRGNPSALIELELNHVSNVIRHRISKLDDVNQQKEYLLGYIKDVDKISYDNYVKLFNQLDLSETKEAINEIIKEGIVLHQAPFFGNIDSEQLRYVFNKYNIKKNRLNISNRTFMVGDLYHLKLKHEPSGKLSAKSLDFNNYSGIPTRTPDSKKYLSRINNNPLRIGEMETSNMMIGGSIKAINQLTNMYSNNPDMRKRLLVELYTGNPFKINTESIQKRTQNNNTKVLNAYFSPLNVSMTFDEPEEDELLDIMDLNEDQLEFLMEKYENLDDINDLTPQEINGLVKEIIEESK